MSFVKRVSTFLTQFMNRQNMTHVAFLVGIGGLTFGAHQLGESLGFGGLGAICGSLALLIYAYLLGAE